MRRVTAWRSGLLPGALITGTFVGIAILSRIWTPEPPTRMRIALRLKPPLASGLAGTDALGHDIVSLLMAGAWNSLTIAGASIALALIVGVLLGTTAAAMRGWLGQTLMRVADLLFAFPALVSGLMIAALIGPGAGTAILAIAVFAVPVFARVSYSAAVTVWARDFCLAATMAGQSRFGITRDHILPNIAGTLAVQAAVQLGLAILVEAGLSFLGLSLPPPAPSWGRMLNEAQTYLGQAPWMAIAPGLAIALAVLGFNLLGDGLRDRLDPRRTF
ncbi:ABC transporter permease [Lichenifustis flavocetrariae]|uniref:ABC transporter permease n=1 Tax=Lichenifustis flavocetrariae TaxID=2949735 RepID=A0AA41Z1T4_9HYPH|nr:ABC transporter permease [Lichenifustis flavocetrariae]MCW6508918.1 ABC transporter permease [Lichenifustis flavocetrariae]